MNFLFSKKGDLYLPAPKSAGLSDNVHGGAAAALMASEVLRNAPPNFMPVSHRSDFFAPTRLNQSRVTLEPLKLGRTCLVYETQIIEENSSKTTARSITTLYKPSPLNSLRKRALKPWAGEADPTKMETLPDRPSPIGGEWMLDATDTRTNGKGVSWFRWRSPIFEDGWEHWFQKILGPADWTAGLVSPHHSDPDKPGPWPNTDLTLNVDRPLSGDWIGVKPRGAYRSEGHGYAYAQILDESGIVGQVTTSFIAPHELSRS